ncbi:hypothetical protein Ae201684P_004089 [Aphanomyces euteiches]|uniref:Rieske domain-containing protein n=1 Tax=Aphanomyces euteiches TaxID=100861 RepID=A0A6G0XTL4_9STRA|nr:hypothetical protein Ae201684_001432 [Aphanomyces euteiches]KAH9075409.1 hypothetical protein Ae201684P_004089 [Aphanomyces euteiches]KAH9141301.1 hypothetical protein AeRB84_014502 [Aphanomyces euteiches]KAH9142335.1 hypothetical protein AeRB84_013604 [Aphanomyces euteiches]KAH9146500.1 hypothetical protein AeRB84_009605 [Aphanomyces euteiches]
MSTAFEEVCPVADLPNNSRRCVLIPGSWRSVLLVHHRNVIYCMDQACYHHGGPLAAGDIEDMGGILSIRCPWHNYKISLEKGEGLYMGLEVGNMTTPVLKSKGVRQRTHPVKVENGMILVHDSSLDGGDSIASDAYAFETKGIPDLETKKDPDEIKLHSRML